ncbi:MAG TPA: FKBP-type peptidyl-prolyl cis-trans isomerase [Gemmatimonadales bacterium]|jgi:FKBP-type peptidyl-prolyl cis-trans isomerase FkpA
MRRAVLASTLLVLAACRPDAPAGGVAGGTGGFAAELGVDTTALTRMPSGLRYQDVAVGSGEEATAGRTAVVHYTGWLPDGKKFDSSRDRGEPFSFPLGAGQVIAGWDQGVAGMKVGGRRKLVIPSELGYGASGAPPDIPPNATLVFDVELLGVQ